MFTRNACTNIKGSYLNALRIISLFLELKENPGLDIFPHTYIFGAKAAPGYHMAKEIIKLICHISKEIEKNPRIKEKLNVVFLEDYCVTLAESLMPAAEISQQISLAGKEASGTGNMKFMINGGITLGTYDGANIEIAEAVGNENIFIFGLKSEEVEGLWKAGYNSSYYYIRNEKLKNTIDFLNTGFDGNFKEIVKYLLVQGVADPYLCLADFNSYDEACLKAENAYKDFYKWNKMSLINIANAGRFAADRSISEYAKYIWDLKPLN
ncbi:glycogen phosphorylase [Holotrichia oblita]|nr:glycogen phosphorylase [Holotrichia oblita]